MRIDESNFETFDTVQRLCGYNYDIVWTDSHNLKGHVDPDVMLDMIQDLICEIHRLQEQLEKKSIEKLKREIEAKKDEIEEVEKINPNHADLSFLYWQLHNLKEELWDAQREKTNEKDEKEIKEVMNKINEEIEVL
jgi:protein subunit release factor A